MVLANCSFARHSAIVTTAKTAAAMSPAVQPPPLGLMMFHTSIAIVTWAPYAAAHGHIQERIRQNSILVSDMSAFTDPENGSVKICQFARLIEGLGHAKL